MIISRSVLLNVRNVSDKPCRENENTHISRPITLFFQSRAVYAIMWKNILEPGRPQMTIGRMRIECWIIKAKENKPTSVDIEDLSNRILYKGPRKCNLSLYVMKETFSCQKAVSNRHQDDGKLNKKTRLPRYSLLHI